MSPLLALAGVAGAGAGLGGLFLLVGLRRTSPQPGTRLGRPVAAWWAPRWRVPGRTLLAGVAAGAVAGAVTGWVAAAVLATAAVIGLPQWVRAQARQRAQTGRSEAIAIWAERISATLTGGAGGLEHTLLATTRTAPAPISGELARLAQRLHDGQPLPAAMHQLAHELADPAADLVIATLLLAAGRPTRQLAPALASLAATTRTQVSARLRVDAGRARQRTSARVIMATTLTTTTLLCLLPGTLLDPYQSVTGQFVLGGVGAIFGVGFTWLARLSRSRTPDRYLPPAPTTKGGPA